MAGKKSDLPPAAKPEPRKSWTNARTAAFLTMLRHTANVSAACRAADMSKAAVYRRRAENIAFRAAWNEALCEGYATLEQLLLSQAIAELTPEDDAPPPAPRLKISERTIVSLLSLHRQTVRDLRAVQRADGETTPDDVEDARAEIEATLALMRDRLATDDDA